MTTNQLDLFASNFTHELPIETMGQHKMDIEGMIAIFSTCNCCDNTTTIHFHKPIHTWEYMLKNWTYLGENIFIVSGGFCSRECEQESFRHKIKAE